MVDDRRGTAVIEKTHGVAIVRLLGEHDLSTVSLWGPKTAQLIDDGVPLVIDVSETEFVDSRSISEILRIDAISREHGRPLVLLYGTTSAVARMFELTGVLDLVERAVTRDEAVERASSSPGSSEASQQQPIEEVLRRMIDAIGEGDETTLRAVIHPDADLGSLIAGRRLSGRDDVVSIFREKRRRGLLQITLVSVEELTPTIGLALESVRRPLEPRGFAEGSVFYLFEVESGQIKWADYFFDREAALQAFNARQAARGA